MISDRQLSIVLKEQDIKQFPDYNGNATSEANARGYRGAARRHHQAGDLHPRAARHVHGHGDARRESGHILYLFKF